MPEEPQRVEVVKQPLQGPGCFGFLLILGFLAIAADWVSENAGPGIAIGLAIIVGSVWFVRSRTAAGTLTQGQQAAGGLLLLAGIAIVAIAITQPDIEI